MSNEYFSDELIHYGIKRRSGRYPYGSGERPYQSGGVAAPPKKKSRKQRKAEEKAAKQEAKQAAAKKKHDDEKQAVLQKGTASQVKSYLGELSNQELRDVTTRLNLEKQINEMSVKEQTTNMQKVDNAMQKIKKIDEWSKIGASMYNTLVGIYNTTEDGQKKPMRKIS